MMATIFIVNATLPYQIINKNTLKLYRDKKIVMRMKLDLKVSMRGARRGDFRVCRMKKVY